LTANTNNVIVTGSIVQFDATYSPSRVIYIAPQDNNTTVYIQPESYTVYIAPMNIEPSTVYIAA
jgi:hypothetical protein